jgi:hypothetical protein
MEGARQVKGGGEHDDGHEHGGDDEDSDLEL